MPKLRYLLFLVTLVIVVWNFTTATVSPRTGDTGDLNSSSLGKVRSVDQQNNYRDGRDARANEVLLWMKDNQRIVENLSGPVKEYCVQARIVRERVKMYPKHQLVNDSELNRIHEDTVAVCERILDLCGSCPAIVQSIKPQMSILLQFLLHPVIVFLSIVATTIFWYKTNCYSVETMLPSLRQMLFWVLEWVIVFPIVVVILVKVFDLIASLFVVAGILSKETTFEYTRKLLFLLSWKFVMLLIRTIFGVERSEKEVLEEFDQILQRMRETQRDVVNLLVARASRNQLRACENEAETELETMRMMKSIYDSSSARVFMFKLKYRLDKIAAKMEEIVDFSERILYLCRPAVAA